MAKNKLNRMLTSPDKDIKRTFGANGVLSRLFRQILLDLNIGPNRFGALLQEYILDRRHSIPNNKKDQTSARGNLTKEFSRPQMTWKVFMKAMRFLQIKRIVFVVELHHSGSLNRKTLHSVTVDTDPTQEFDDENPHHEDQEKEQLQQVGLGVQYLDQPHGDEQ